MFDNFYATNRMTDWFDLQKLTKMYGIFNFFLLSMYCMCEYCEWFSNDITISVSSIVKGFILALKLNITNIYYVIYDSARKTRHYDLCANPWF